jgi:hypothetical protein
MSSNNYQERMLAMAESLLAATKESKITWSTTDADNKYIYAGTRSSVTIEHTWDRYNDEMTTLCLLNNRGIVVDSLETEGTHTDDKWIPAPWNELLYDLYHAARRAAHNVDDALESMMSDIERGTPSPSGPSKKATADPWETQGYSDEPPF